MEQKLYDAVTSNPIIAAIKDEDGLRKVCKLEDIHVVFILYGNVLNIADIVKTIQDSGKIAMVHIDLIEGLSSKPVSVDYVKNNLGADGIITTKSALAMRAKELNMYIVLRFFIIDSIALRAIQKLDYQYSYNRPDFIEVLPGVMPKIIKKIVKYSNLPLIASGMIIDKEDVIQALDSGAIAISTTSPRMWEV